MAMSNTVLLASENERLRMENQRQKRKRAQRRMYIAKGSILSRTEGASRVHTAQERAAEGTTERAVEVTNE
jgi:hypothetical protein